MTIFKVIQNTQVFDSEWNWIEEKAISYFANEELANKKINSLLKENNCINTKTFQIGSGDEEEIRPIYFIKPIEVIE